ncbi:hypothetical protein [Caldanaerovirga acetigignens]|uniref:hypothetical protein n=1 Tax=Caldanaerovirga acetigignens TaxID=447595 RepID=UPI00165ED1BA|nr:hypothetical protein [Caldanaerovirga acetigignens]
MRCDFCGYEFNEEQEGIKGCTGCPMAGHCGKVKCPRCGYEVVRSSSFFKWLKQRRHK